MSTGGRFHTSSFSIRHLKRLYFPFWVAVALSLQAVHASTTSGRFTTALYSFERALQDTATSGSFRAYQTGRLKVTGIASRPELSFQTYGRVSHDFLDDRVTDPTYRLYHAYLRWVDARERFKATLGRQTVFAGVGVGRIDGLRLRISPAENVRIDVYGGALVYGGHEGVRSPGDASLVGGHLVVSDLLGTSAGVSLYRRSRELTADSSTARVLAGLQSVEIKPGEVEQQMIGFDLMRTMGHATLSVRWDVSTPHAWKTRRFEGNLRYRRPGWTVSGNFLYRTPYVDQNSVFSIFTQSSNQEMSIRFNRRFSRHLGLFSEVTRVSYDGDGAYRVNLGVNLLNGYVGYTKRTGFGGSADGLNGVLRYRLGPTVSTSASIGWTRFRTYSGSGLRSRVLANTVGVTVRPMQKLSLSLQGQRLSQDLQSTAANPFRGAGHDLRVFFSASTWFFHRGRGE